MPARVNIESLSPAARKVVEADLRKTERRFNPWAPYRSKTERAYAAWLDDGRWKYESIRFRIGHDCWYTPDFVAFDPSCGRLECREVKGWMREDARVKIKAAAAIYPCVAFVLVERDGSDWKHTTVRC